jgi:hypothetical protein
MDFISRHSFGFDDDVAIFVTEVTNSKRQKSVFELKDELIEISVKDDYSLHLWLDGIQKLRQEHV